VSLVSKFFKRASIILPVALGACSSENQTTEIPPDKAYCVHVTHPDIFDSKFPGGVLPPNYIHDLSDFRTIHNFYIKKPGGAENPEEDKQLLEARANAHQQPDAEAGKFKILALGLTPSEKRKNGAPYARLEGYGNITMTTLFEADINAKTCTISHPNAVFGETRHYFQYEMK
jgi:hypothetical protein